MNVNQGDAPMTSKERTVCKQIAATGGNPHKQRAQALLLLDHGASREESVAQSGLTPNQVKYWLGRFRSLRLNIFPAEMLTAAPPSTAATAAVTAADSHAEAKKTALAAVKPGAKTGKEKAEKNENKKKKDKKKDKRKDKKKSGKKSKNNKKDKRKKGKQKDKKKSKK